MREQTPIDALLNATNKVLHNILEMQRQTANLMLLYADVEQKWR